MALDINRAVSFLGPMLSGLQQGGAASRQNRLKEEQDLAEWAMKEAESQANVGLTQAQTGQAGAQTQLTQAQTGQAQANVANIESQTAINQRELETKPYATLVESLGKDIATFASGKVSGIIPDTPENNAALNQMFTMRNEALKKVTGIEIPNVSFKMGDVPSDARYLEAVSNLFQLKDLNTLAQETGQDPVELARQLAKEFQLAPEQIMLLGSPGLPATVKATMAGQIAANMKDIRDTASKNVMELLKNPQVLKWGEAAGKWAVIGQQKQKDAIASAMIQAGMDDQTAVAIAGNFPIFKRTLEAKDEADIKTRIWAKQMDYQMGKETNVARIKAAQIGAAATIGAAKIRSLTDAEIAELNAITKVQTTQMNIDAGAGAGGSKVILDARKNIVSAINTLNDPLQKGKMTDTQVAQLNGQINQSIADVMKKSYAVTMAPDSVSWVRQYAAGQGHSWKGLKSMITAGLVQNKVKDPTAVNRVLKAVWTEFGFSAAGEPYGGDVNPETYMKATAKPSKPKKR